MSDADAKINFCSSLRLLQMSALNENEPGVTIVCSTIVGELEGTVLKVIVGGKDGES